MDTTTAAAEATVKAPRGAVPDAATQSAQGAFAGRRVSMSSEPTVWLFLNEGRGAGSAAHVPAERRSQRLTLGCAVRKSGPLAMLANGPGTGLSDSMAQAATSKPASHPLGPPWLNPARRTALEESDRRLQRHARHWLIARNLREDLSAAIGQVQSLEQKTLQAHALLEKSRTDEPGDADSRTLSFILRSQHPEWSKAQTELGIKLDGLWESGAFSPADTLLVAELQQRFDDAHRFWRRIGLSWLGAAERVESTLPLPGSPRVAVASRVVPGRLLGAHLAAGYPQDAFPGAPRETHYPHVPDLALTSLTNAGDETLFVGLRHGMIHADEFTADFLAALPEDRLQRMLTTIFDTQLRPNLDIASRDQAVRTACRKVKSNRVFTEHLAFFTRIDICNYMHMESLTAALLAHPLLHRQLEPGQAISLPVISIAMLTPGDVVHWSVQKRLFNATQNGAELIKLEVRDRFNQNRPVSAAVSVRQFALPVAGRLGQEVHDANRKSVERLLGPLGSSDLGGDLLTRVADLKALDRETTTRFQVAGAEHFRLCRDQGAFHPAAIAARTMLTGLEQDNERLRMNARTLEQAGEQLKALWMQHGEWPAGVDAQAAAARLALVGHLMDETPLLSCASGRDFTARLDPHVKLLATAADCDDGNLPSIDMDKTAAWRDARSGFTHPGTPEQA